MCQLAWDLNSDRYDRSQNTDINNSQTRYHSTTALTAFCCLQFSMYLAADVAMRAVDMATSKSFFSKNAKNKRKKQAVQMLRRAISRRIQIYAMIGVELRTHGEIFVQSQALTLAMCPLARMPFWGCRASSGHHNLFSTGPRGQLFFFFFFSASYAAIIFTGNRQNSEGNVNSYLFFVIYRPNVQKCATSRVKS